MPELTAISRKKSLKKSKHVYSMISLLFAGIHNSLFCSFPRRKGHNGPLSTPSPFSSSGITTASFHPAKPLVLSRLEANDNVCFASSESKNVDSGTWS
jgi:hypothetical protein